MLHRYSFITGLSVASVLFGCGDDPQAPPGPPANLAVAPADTLVLVGSTVQLAASVTDSAGRPTDSSGLVWETSDSSVARADHSGLITGISAGSATIRARLNSLTDSASVTVLIPIGSVTLTPSNPGIVPGAMQELVVDSRDENGDPLDRTPLRWSSSHPDVATVDSVGVIRAVAPGSATIMAEFLESEATARVDVKLNRYTSVSVGAFHSCAVTEDAEVWCWGMVNSAPIGDGTQASTRRLPVRVPSNEPFVTVSVAQSHACALTPAGQAYCWGTNNHGRLGTGMPEDALAPQPVAGDHVFSEISAGDMHVCAVTPAGEAFCWGWFEALGNGGNTNVDEPVKVMGGLTFDAIGASPSNSPHTCGVTSGGIAHCWGNNAHGQIGDSTQIFADLPTQVEGGLGWKQLSVARRYNCGIATDDLAYCWGQNAFEALGLGFEDGTVLTPQAVTGGRTYRFIAGNWFHTCAVGTDDVGYCWGEGSSGKLGDGADTTAVSPSPIDGGLRFVMIEPGHSHTCGLATDGLVYCWGSNNGEEGGVLGAGPIGFESFVPVPVLGQR